MLISIGALVLCLIAGILFIAGPSFFYHIGVASPLDKRVRKAPGVSPLAGDPNWLDSQRVEDVWVDTGDGLSLHGYYVAAEAPVPAGTVILAHGYGGDGKQLARFAQMFHHRFAMNVLLPDARGYGLSQGEYIGFGWHERLDLLTWIRWVKERHAGATVEKAIAGAREARVPPGNIALFGLSMGASTVLMASGEALPPEVKVIIEDCGYTSAAEELGWRLKRQFHIPGRLYRQWLLHATSKVTMKKAGYRFEEASALEQVKKSRTPTLFIHGEADKFVPYSMVHTLYEACSAPKELYTVPGALHAQAYTADPETYKKRVIQFIQGVCDRKGRITAGPKDYSLST
jgi:fermentation-respiration switch protein FrsA (DUF1100 family)